MVDLLGSSGESVNFYDHLVEASRFDWTHAMSSAHLVISKPLVLLCFVHTFLGQKYFKIKLYSDSLVFMIRSLCILGFPLSLGIRITMDTSHRLRSLALRSAMEMMLWWSFHILSLKSSFSFEYCTPSGVRREWQCPRLRSEGEVVVLSFQLRNPFLYSSSGMVFC